MQTLDMNAFHKTSTKDMLKVQAFGVVVFGLIIWIFSSYPAFDAVMITSAVFSLAASLACIAVIGGYKMAVMLLWNRTATDLAISLGTNAVYLFMFYKAGMMWSFWISLITVIGLTVFAQREAKRLNLKELI